MVCFWNETRRALLQRGAVSEKKRFFYGMLGILRESASFLFCGSSCSRSRTPRIAASFSVVWWSLGTTPVVFFCSRTRERTTRTAVLCSFFLRSQKNNRKRQFKEKNRKKKRRIRQDNYITTNNFVFSGAETQKEIQTNNKETISYYITTNN